MLLLLLMRSSGSGATRWWTGSATTTRGWASCLCAAQCSLVRLALILFPGQVAVASCAGPMHRACFICVHAEYCKAISIRRGLGVVPCMHHSEMHINSSVKLA